MITKLQVKYIQSLGQKKFRDEAGVFVAEGPKIIGELLRAGHSRLEQLYATRKWIDAHGNTGDQMDVGSIIEIKEQDLERISFLQTPHEVLGIFKKPQAVPAPLGGTVSLMLDGLGDPGNMGTIIRIADWFGIRHITCSMDCADAFAPKVVQGSMGSIARVQLQYTSLLKQLTSMPMPLLYAAVLDGENLYAMQPLKQGVIVIGNESRGISSELLAHCSHRITIPRIGHAESLNAAVAAGIILSHLVGR